MSVDVVRLEPVPLDEAHARKLTFRISLLMGTFLDQRDKIVVLMDEAREGDAHLALGYRSWTEYMSTEFADVLPRLGIEDRKTLVGELSAAGMSTRAIGSIVGVSHKTIVKDLQSQVVPEVPPAHDVALAMVDMSTGEIREPVTGVDGKTYPARTHEPKVARRRPIPDAMFDAIYELRKSVERLERLHDDDRFPANRPALSERYLGQLTDFASRVTGLEDELRTGHRADGGSR